VTFYRRRLPHFDETGRPVFLTWRLHGSLPVNRPFPAGTLSSGQAFAAMDRLLDQVRVGPSHLRRPALADLVVEAIHYGAAGLGHYALHAYAVMPNHVHLLVTPVVALCKLTKSLKGITAKQANALLALTGSPFWQEESYDRLVRHERELTRSGITSRRIPFAPDWRWLPVSTAGRAPGGRLFNDY
jgi:putative DNA methylase